MCTRSSTPSWRPPVPARSVTGRSGSRPSRTWSGYAPVSVDSTRSDPGIGAAARATRAAALDAWLASLLPEPPDGVALVAVGGLGRRECAPHGDVDLVLLHTGVPGVDEVAAKIWYPVWDARVGLDHSVRTVDEALSVAQEDVKVALGLLD